MKYIDKVERHKIFHINELKSKGKNSSNSNKQTRNTNGKRKCPLSRSVVFRFHVIYLIYCKQIHDKGLIFIFNSKCC